MRTTAVLVYASILSLAACHTAEPRDDVPQRLAAIADATVRRIASGADPTPAVIAADPATAQLLRAALANLDGMRNVILGNLANVNTPSFKKRVTLVSSTLLPGSDSIALPSSLRTVPIFTAGTLEGTDNSLDVAINGEGFFPVQLADGTTGYTRDGSFKLNSERKLVTGQGHITLPEITLPADLASLTIDAQGRVSGTTAGNPSYAQLFGQLNLARFINPQGLEIIDGVNYRQTEASGPPVTGNPASNGLGQTQQGFVERSNVQLVSEQMDLIAIERQRDALLSIGKSLGYFETAATTAPGTGTAQDAALRTSDAPPSAPFAALDAVTSQLLATALDTCARIESIHAANIANANVTAYKRREPVLGQRTIAASRMALDVQELTGSRADLAPGELERSERPLDVAIHGDGWFAVQKPDGTTGYTRDGSFKLNADGKLVTNQGCILLPEITLPVDLMSLSIDARGHVDGTTAGSPNSALQFGRLQLARFPDHDCLCAGNDGVWDLTEAAGAPITDAPGNRGLGTLQQGYVERSNVDVTRESLALQVAARQRERLVALCRQFGFVVR